jgi:hypothetical protein
MCISQQSMYDKLVHGIGVLERFSPRDHATECTHAFTSTYIPQFMTNQYIHHTSNSSMSANHISTNGPLQHIAFLPNSSPYTQEFPRVYVLDRVIYNEKKKQQKLQITAAQRQPQGSNQPAPSRRRADKLPFACPARPKSCTP